MPLIDSANLQCDGCGVICNHHVMVFPDGWVRDGKESYYCPDCAPYEALTPEGVMLIPTSAEWKAAK